LLFFWGADAGRDPDFGRLLNMLFAPVGAKAQ